MFQIEEIIDEQNKKFLKFVLFWYDEQNTQNNQREEWLNNKFEPHQKKEVPTNREKI